MNFLLENGATAPISWSATSVPAFLQLDLPSGTIQGNSQTTVHATLDTALAQALSPGTSAGTLTFHNDSGLQGDVDIDCTLSVSAAGVSIQILPASDFSSTGPAAGPFVPPSTVYSLTNTGGGTLDWQATAGNSWVGIAPASGQLAPNASVDVTLSIDSASTGALAPALYWSLVEFRDSSDGSTLDTRNVALSVTSSSPQSGWTSFTPSGDTRTVFVSSSLGNDGNTGLSQGSPKRTIAAGKSLLRSGFPDWLLLKKGDTWDEVLGNWQGISGRSIAERMLIGSYGTGERPLLRTGAADCAWMFNNPNSSNYVAFVGLHLWANTFDGSGASPVGFFWLGGSDGLLIEDCMVEGYSNNLTIQGYPVPKRHTNVSIRRNVIIDAKDDGGYGQGLYVERVDGMLMEENVIDGNGWNAVIPGTIYAHNVYVQNGCTGMVFRNNIVANTDGAQMRSGGVMDDNLFLHNAIAMVFGGGSEPDLNLAGVTGSVSRNVVLDGNNFTASVPRGWTLAISNVASATVADNIFSGNVSGTNPRALSIEYANGLGGNDRGIENTTFQNNIIHDWGGSIEFFGTPAQTVNVHLLGNAVQNTVSSDPLVNHSDPNSPAGVVSGGNTFYTSQIPSGRWMRVGGPDITLPSWMTLVQDGSSLGQQVSYPNAGRTIATYQASIGGTPTLGAFLVEARKQSKDNWRTQYTAAAVRDYIRAGFGL